MLGRYSSEIRTGCANERPSGSVEGVVSHHDPYSDRQPWSVSVKLRTDQEALGGSKNTGLIIAGNLSRRVDAERKDEGDAWEAEGCKGAIETSYETVEATTRVNVEASDPSRIVGAIGNGSG